MRIKTSKIILLLCSLFLNLYSYSQNKVIQGSVSFDRKDIDMYQIDIYSLSPDTSYIKSFHPQDVDFQYELALPSSCLRVLISAFGYESFAIDTCLQNNMLNLGAIDLKIKEFSLKEVVIEYKKPAINFKGSQTSINIKNTILSDMGDASDVLERLPGVVKQGDSYSVLGRGEPIIYIDGRQIMDNKELSILKSQYISEISIERNPSSIHGSNISAVIEIKTIPMLKDILDLQIGNITRLQQKVGNYSNMQVNFKRKKLTTRFSYGYSSGGSILKEQSYQNIYHTDYTFQNNLDYKLNNNNKSHILSGMSNLQLNEKSRLGIQYNGYYSIDEEKQTKNQRFTSNQIFEYRFIDHQADINSYIHSLSASYSYNRNKTSNLLVIADYAIKNTKVKNNIREENLANGNNSLIDYSSNSKYNIYTVSVRYNFLFANKFKSILGARYAHTNNKSNTSYIASYGQATNNLLDQLSAIYLQTEKKLNKFSIEGTLRYEYNHTKLETFDEDLPDTRKRHYSSLLPNLKIGYDLNDNINMELNYSRRMARPSFYEMNPIINYQDSLSTVSGSPYIKPTRIDNLNLYLTFWSKLSFELGYKKSKDEIVQTTIVAGENTNKTLMVPINLDKTEYYNLSVSYGETLKKWTFNASAYMEIPDLNIPEKNNRIRITKPGYIFSINNSYDFSEKISAYCDFSFTTDSYNTITYQHSYNNMTIGVMGKFVKKRLNVQIVATDILNGYHLSNWDEKYLNIHSSHRSRSDLRGLKFSISYRFNDIKAKLSAPQGNSDILNRAMN